MTFEKSIDYFCLWIFIVFLSYNCTLSAVSVMALPTSTSLAFYIASLHKCR